jgi:hypothetical protein
MTEGQQRRLDLWVIADVLRRDFPRDLERRDGILVPAAAGLSVGKVNEEVRASLGGHRQRGYPVGGYAQCVSRITGVHRKRDVMDTH